MPKRSDNLETLRLAIELMRRIPRKRKVTAKDLHLQMVDAGVNRDLRTIQRQLEMLSNNFEIECDNTSKPFGYSWRENAKALAIPNLTLQESLLLGMAEEHLRNLLPSRLMRSMKEFFTQASRNLHNFTESSALLEREWTHKVRFIPSSLSLIAPKISSEVFDAVSEALYSNRWLSIKYINANSKVTKADIMPLGLVQQGQRIYVVCRFKDYENERSLAMHRIHSAAMLANSFIRPKGFDLKKYDDDGRFGLGNGKRVRLSFNIDESQGIYLRETPLSTDQKVTPAAKNQLNVTATVVDTDLLDRWLLGFGTSISKVKRQVISE